MTEFEATIDLSTIQWAPRSSRMLEATRVAELINALPQEIYMPGLSLVAQAACLEIFFVHVRSLIPFLTLTHSGPRDFTARDIFPDWQPPQGARLAKLEEYWQQASEQVVHFSKRRARQDDGVEIIIDVSREALDEISNNLFSEWDRYAELANGLLTAKRADLHWKVERPMADGH